MILGIKKLSCFFASCTSTLRNDTKMTIMVFYLYQSTEDEPIFVSEAGKMIAFVKLNSKKDVK